MAKCKGKAMWSYLRVLDTKYNPCWRISVIMDETEAKKMVELGLKSKIKRTDPITNPEEAELGPYKIKFQRYEDKRGKNKGKKNTAPEYINSDNEPLEDMLGNGSDVIVKFDMYNWNNNFGSGVGVDLQGVKVINMIPYVQEEKPTVSEEAPSLPTGQEDDEDKW